MYGIQTENFGSRVTVGMRGEFDAYALPDLREMLDHVFTLGKPVVVDLSRVTFLDLQSAREIVVRFLIQAEQLVFENPSTSVLASIRIFGMDGKARINTGREDPSIFSEA